MNCRKIIFDLWPLIELFDILRKTLVSRSSQKPLTLDAWKFIYNKTLLSWWKLSFVIACSMVLERVIALETWDFLRKNLKLVNYLSYRDGTNWNVISDLWPWKYVKVKGQGHQNSKKRRVFHNSFTTWNI